MRAFIAISFPDFVKDALFQAVREAKKSLGTANISWVRPENYHLTLYFLGEISEAMLWCMESPLRQAVAEISPFPIDFEKICLFPSPKKPHAVVASLKPQEELMKLQQKVHSVFSSIGETKRDPRSFLPHATLARIKETSTCSFNPFPWSLSFTVQEFHLFESSSTENGTSYHSRLQIQLKTT